MRGDLWFIIAGMLAIGAVNWAFWGNPVNVARHSGPVMSVSFYSGLAAR